MSKRLTFENGRVVDAPLPKDDDLPDRRCTRCGWAGDTEETTRRETGYYGCPQCRHGTVVYNVESEASDT